MGTYIYMIKLIVLVYVKALLLGTLVLIVHHVCGNCYEFYAQLRTRVGLPPPSSQQPHLTRTPSGILRMLKGFRSHKSTHKKPPKKTQGRPHNAPQRACSRCRCTRKRVLLTTYAAKPHLTRTPSGFLRVLKCFRSHKSIQKNHQ